MKRILVLPDDWETWVSLDGAKEDPKPEVWWVTDEAYERLQEGVAPAELLEDGKVRRREAINAGAEAGVWGV